MNKETNAAKSMDADAHFGPGPHARLTRAYRAQQCGMKRARRAEEHRVEGLRRARDSREPFESPDGERKNYVSLFSTGARSATDGPFSTLPSGSKREPWQGQSQVVSFRFQCTMHFKCGQTAVISCSAPASSRYTAIFFAPRRTTAPWPGFRSSAEEISPLVK